MSKAESWSVLRLAVRHGLRPEETLHRCIPSCTKETCEPYREPRADPVLKTMAEAGVRAPGKE